MMIEDEVRAAFARTAESVVPDPDPMGRLLRRRIRQRRTRIAVGGAVLATALAAVSTAPFGPLFGQMTGASTADGHPLDSEWSRRLIESPTRGNLAGNPALVDEATRMARDSEASDLDRIKVLFLGDVPGGRLTAWVRYNDVRAALYYRTGSAGAPLDKALRGGGGGGNFPVEPYLAIGDANFLVGLAPAGCRFASSSNGIIQPDGTVTRTWTEAATVGWIERDTPVPAERWRITCENVVRYEGPIRPLREVPDTPGGAPDSVLQGARGDIDRDTALAAAELLPKVTAPDGLPVGTPRVLWCDEPPGGGGKVAVAVAPSSGGGVAVVLLRRGKVGEVSLASGPKSVHIGPSDDPTSYETRKDYGLAATAVSGTADLVAVRIPQRDQTRAVWTNRILVIGPPSATTVQVDGTAPVAMVDGVGELTVSGWITGILVAKDRDGKVVARTSIAEPADGAVLLGEPIITAW